ncbi:hypothetical protein HUW63_04550 [Myxococcus sp. AM001]|nr:hypothetical protein [Myxococcus sp. AM001]
MANTIPTTGNPCITHLGFFDSQPGNIPIFSCAMRVKLFIRSEERNLSTCRIVDTTDQASHIKQEIGLIPTVNRHRKKPHVVRRHVAEDSRNPFTNNWRVARPGKLNIKRLSGSIDWNSQPLAEFNLSSLRELPNVVNLATV